MYVCMHAQDAAFLVVACMYVSLCARTHTHTHIYMRSASSSSGCMDVCMYACILIRNGPRNFVSNYCIGLCACAYMHIHYTLNVLYEKVGGKI